MSIPATLLFEEALHLPESLRADLAARLLESLDFASEEDVEQAWAEEIRNRLEDIQKGRAKPIPWAEARKLILEESDDPASC
jgi:putative addiction module component (TIGR02574 family)